MNFFRIKYIASVLLCSAGLSLFVSCKEGEKETAKIVINEVMASNKTGLQVDGDLCPWIEVCNVSKDEINLKDYAISRDSGKVKVALPERVIEPKECVVVFATKKQLKDSLCCDINITNSNDTIQIVSQKGNVLSEVTYKKLKDDQVLKRIKKGEYKKTYSSTPGFANNEEGRKQYLVQLDESRQGPLRIWEFMNKSDSLSVGKKGVGRTWVEIKNTSDKAVDLADYTLRSDTSKLSMPQKTLAPGALLLVYDANKKLHGESVILEKSGEFVDGICAAETYLGVSIGCTQEKKGYYFFDEPTPGKENTTTAYPGITDDPNFNIKGGVYSQDSIFVCLKDTNATVYYTIDGSIPTTSSPVFRDSILLDSTTVLRAFAVDSVNLRSKMMTSTYLVRVKHSLPVISITMDNADLYDYNKGIYAMGPGAVEKFPHQGANFWKDWEKRAHIEFFDGNDGFSYDCGIKIFGAFSRGRDKKSFHIKFHRRYGEGKLDYDLYKRGKKDHVSSFVLRSGSQDDNGTMVRDEFFTSLMAEGSPTLHVQANRPVVLYLNGKYFGVYFIREKINAEFVANHLNVSPESATLLVAQGAPQVGTATEYRELEAYVRSHDMLSDEAYKYMDSHIDFQSLIDYKIGEFYTGNCDVGNIRYFKSSDKNCNQKWHWLFYDLDWGFYYSTPLSFYIREGARKKGGSLSPYNLFINRLLKNPQFRKLFLERWSYHRSHTFNKEHATAVFDGLIKAIEPEMQQNCERWPKMSYKKWQNNLTKFRARIDARLPVMDENVMKELAVTPQEKATYFK